MKFLFALSNKFCLCKSSNGWLIMTPLFVYLSSGPAIMGPILSGSTALTVNGPMVTWKWKGDLKFMWSFTSLIPMVKKWIVGPTTEEFKETGAWTYAYRPDGSSVIVREGYLTIHNKRWRKSVPHGRLYMVGGHPGYLKTPCLHTAAEKAEQIFKALEELSEVVNDIQTNIDNSSLQA